MGETAYSDAKKFIYEIATKRELNISPDSVNKIINRICDTNTISANDINQSPERIVVNNGILDTKNRILFDHNPEEKHINKIPIFYDPEAKITPEFDEFLKTIFGKTSMIKTMFVRIIFKKMFGGIEVTKASTISFYSLALQSLFD